MIYFIRAFLLVLHTRFELVILSESNFEFDAFAVSPMELVKLASFNILRGIDIISPSRQKGELADVITLSFPN